MYTMKSLLSTVFIIFTMGLSFGISSCSDDTTTTPTGDGDIMPLKTGSYYVYNAYRIDSITKQKDMSSLRVDSVVVGSPTTKEGKSATLFSTFVLGALTSSDYYVKEGQTVLGYWKFLPPGVRISPLIDSIIPQSQKWSKFADYTWPVDSNWAIRDTTVTNVSIPGVPIALSALISLKGKRNGSPETVSLNGKSYPNTQKFTLTMNVSIASLQVASIEQYIWIAKDVGIVKEELPALDLNVAIPGMIPINFKGDGYVKELLRHSVK